jgi:hypothetical protein
LSKIDSDYLAQVSARIVRMFERYAQNIDPQNADFLAFIRQYLKTKNINHPEAIQYSELYEYIKEGIREYLRGIEKARKEK